jgi:hypothetical protein
MNQPNRYLNFSLIFKILGIFALGLGIVTIIISITPSSLDVSGTVSNLGYIDGKHDLTLKYFDAPIGGKFLKSIELKNVEFVDSKFATSYSTRLFDKPLYAYAELCVDLNNNNVCTPFSDNVNKVADASSCQRAYTENGIVASWDQFFGKKQSLYYDVKCAEIINPALYSPQMSNKLGKLLSNSDFANPTDPSTAIDNSTNTTIVNPKLTLAGNTLSVQGGNSVKLPDFINQTISNIQNFFNTDQTIVNQVSSDVNDNDKQKIALNGNSLIIENGNSVDLGSLNLLINTNNLVNGAITFDKLANCTAQNQILKYYATDPDATGPLKAGWNCESPATFSDTDQQILAFNSTTNQLTILGGNSITLPNGFTGASVVGNGATQTLQLTAANGTITSIAIPDNDTIYSAGTGINILAGNTIQNTGVLSVIGVGPIQVSSGQNPSVSLTPCTIINQILKWNGTNWVCATDQDTIYTAGAGIALTGNTFSNTGVLTSNGTVNQIINTGTLQNPIFALAPIGTAGTFGSATTTNVITTDAQGRVTSVTPTTITPAASSITGAQNLTPASNKVVVIGGTGAVLTAAAVDINEANLSLQNIGGALSTVQQNAIALQNLGGALSIAQQGNILLSNLGGSLSSTQLGAINLSTLGGQLDLATQVSGVLPVTNGGTGATTAAGARTNLGLSQEALSMVQLLVRLIQVLALLPTYQLRAWLH